MSNLIAQVKKPASEVYKILGPGYQEKVYEEALAHEFRLRNIPYERQKNCELIYKRYTIGNIRIDLIVKNTLIVEAKSVKKLNESHRNQVRAYYISSGLTNGILLNFPPEGDDIVIEEVEPVEIESYESKKYEKKGDDTITKIKNAANEVCSIISTEFIYQNLEIYKNALSIEFRLHNIPYTYRPLEVLYKNHTVDYYSPGFVIENKYIVNLCSQPQIDENAIEDIHYALRLAGLKKGLIINFPPDSVVAEVKPVNI